MQQTADSRKGTFFLAVLKMSAVKKYIKIVVATHKKYRMPEDGCYLPLQVGKAGKEALGYQGDDTGDNISEKNPYYCELTGLYWAWKNLDAEYIGLVHYRRYFASKKRKLMFWKKDRFEQVLTGEEFVKLLQDTDILLPSKRHYYYIESLYSHYAHTHYEEHLTIARDIVGELTPEYLDAYDRVMKRTSGHMFNMFVMSKAKCDEYCSWLFPILEELEKRVDYKQYDQFQQRMFGRASELLLNVWIEQTGYPYKTVPIVSIEKNHLLKRIPAFLKAKFFHKKYNCSF